MAKEAGRMDAHDADDVVEMQLAMDRAGEKSKQAQQIIDHQALVHAGQRRVNLIWEYTQSAVTVLVVCSYVGLCVFVTANGKGEIPSSLTLTVGTVVGFYYGRTNHERIGGVGRKANEGENDYKGR